MSAPAASTSSSTNEEADTERNELVVGARGLAGLVGVSQFGPHEPGERMKPAPEVLLDEVAERTKSYELGRRCSDRSLARLEPELERVRVRRAGGGKRLFTRSTVALGMGRGDAARDPGRDDDSLSASPSSSRASRV